MEKFLRNRLDPTPFLGVARLLKRLFDVVFSSLILVLLSPVLAVIAIGVKFRVR